MKEKWQAQFPFLVFLAIIFFLPFERVPTFPLAGVDIKINTILGFVTIFVWLCAILVDYRRWKIQPNTLAGPIALFVAALFLSLTQALDLSRSLEVLAFSLFTIILSLVTVNLVTEKPALEKVVYVLFISATLVGLFGLFQFMGDVAGLSSAITLLKTGYTSAIFGFPRIQAFSMEPLYFANYLLIPLSLALAYFFARANLIKRWWLVAFITLLLINFILTLSRGAYLALAVSLLVLAIFYFRQIFSRQTIVILFILLVAGGAVFFALSRGQSQSVSKFIAHVTLQDAKTGSSDSVQGRLSSFDFAYGAWQRFRVLGVGIGNYGPYFRNYPSLPPAGGWDIVNNEYLEIMAETGLVGLIAFSLIILVAIWRSFLAIQKATEPFLRATMIGLLAAFVGVMVQYNFFSTLYIIHIWILIGLLIAVQNVILKTKGQA